MNWLWAYFRRKTMESILAGAHDAIAGSGGAHLSDEEAFRAMRAMFGTAEQDGDQPTLPGPPPPAISEQRRPVGRPRKYQEPPG
jgi:hypothetical protein